MSLVTLLRGGQWMSRREGRHLVRRVGCDVMGLALNRLCVTSVDEGVTFTGGCVKVKDQVA